MTILSKPLRPARREDAAHLADLMVLASGGLCLGVWDSDAAPGETPLEAGRRRAARDQGAFSWRNAVVADEGAGAVAALVGYPLPEAPEPIGPDLPPVFVPLQELENEAAGTFYVNMLATDPAHREQGHATRLLKAAETLGQRAGARGLSLIVASGNGAALRLYRREGFEVRASRPAAGAGRRESQWLLMTRALRGSAHEMTPADRTGFP